ncbi:site-specific DNA-methyltransferase [Vescimonas sp.]|uniref:site-specific DNA-methyltransferase n=1 Tax=Vescimonas sp. TaxID=2892404 RepID=UPI003F7D189A
MDEQLTFEFEQRPTIKGFPELRWTGKRPYRSTQYYPAQLRESYGEEQNGWINKIFWGDNLQVMSHLLKEYRGKIDLIYIDPPFDSKADYKRKIEVKNVGKTISDSSSFEEKQYGDIWTNDEYLQFMYERLILMRELLSEKGCIYVHCDWHKVHHLRCLLDEVFGSNNFVNEIVWHYADYMQGNATTSLPRKHDTILFYSKTPKYYYERVKVPLDKPVKRNRVIWNGKTKALEVARDGQGKIIYDEFTDRFLDSVWEEDVLNIGQTSVTRKTSSENLNYPTQKPKRILELIIEASSQPGDLVFDCFMGSGTTQSVAMKLGRRFIGADINLGAIQTTTKRLLSVAKELENSQTGMGSADDTKYTGFEVYNVNNYDFFRNPVEARDLLIAALEIQPFPQSDIWDGELDGRMVKIMPVNRIATKADLKELLANLPYKTYEKRKEENPNQPVERITIVCMGHEPDLKGAMEQELTDYKVDIQIMDILRDKADLQLKRDSEAEIVREGGKLVIRAFYPMNLMQKLSLQKEYVEDWRQLVDSVMIDWNYDGVVMQPAVTDVPGKSELVKGIYDIPEGSGTIKVKITDLLSESLEVEVR